MALPLPPEPDISAVVRRLREHKQFLLAQDAETMIGMTERWLQLESTLEAQISLLAREMAEMHAAGEVVGINRLLKLERYQVLLRQLDAEVIKYNGWALNEIALRQRLLGQLGADHALEAVQLSLEEAGLAAGEFFNRLPTSAIENMVGIAGPGGPLGELLGEAFPAAAERMTQALIEGVALGLSPTQTAKLMMDGMAEGLVRCTRIARTEQLRVYREASRQQYETTGAVTGYQRLASKYGNTCATCIALDGEVYPTNELMYVHPNCRCSMIPNVRGVGPIEREFAGDWFAKQDSAFQRQVLGPGRFDLYDQGKIGLQDLVVKSEHPVWGPSIGIASLKSLQP